jgi:hypothetical protein
VNKPDLPKKPTTKPAVLTPPIPKKPVIKQPDIQ